MTPVVNIETIHNRSIDARVTCTAEFHIKDGQVVQVNLTVTDGVMTPANEKAIRRLLEYDELVRALQEIDA